MQYTEEQIIRANQTDLVSFLNAQGEQLMKSGKEYRWKKHDSVTVSGNRWYRHSQGRGGYPVDINVNIKMYIFDHLRMYIFAILPLDRYIFLSDKIFL